VRPGEAVAWAIKRGMPLPDVLKTLASTGTQSKLTDEQRAAIGVRIGRGEAVAALSREFNVSRRTIDTCKPVKKTTPSVWSGHVTKNRMP
jgi:hypothetical protein